MKLLKRAPNRRIERWNLLDALYSERQFAPSLFAPVANDRAVSFNPLDDAAAADSLETDERISPKGETPTGWHTNVDTQKLSVNAGDRVMNGWYRYTTEGGPK